MREIKFRGKRVHSKRWVNGYYIFQYNQHYIFEVDGLNGSKVIKHEVEPKTIGQYTGIKDKNGVEIYEGNIVEYDNGIKAYVIFKEGGFCGYDSSATSSDEAYTLLSCTEENPFDGFDFELEVIGNIHDKTNKL